MCERGREAFVSADFAAQHAKIHNFRGAAPCFVTWKFISWLFFQFIATKIRITANVGMFFFASHPPETLYVVS